MRLLNLIILLSTCTIGLAEERPNILWLTSEDNSVAWMGCYGNPQAQTPNLDMLAKEGFLYENCFANAPVCAPSRSTWITGMLAISNGTFPMRSRYTIPHDRIPYYPDLLRAAGYFTANCRKTDFNIGGRDDADCWDRNDAVNWKQLEQNQPFFQVINFAECHESAAHGSVENTKHDPANIHLRSYHPDLPGVRKSYAKYYDAIERMDASVARYLNQLDAHGLTDNTIVVYNSDHGGVLPRSKRYIFSSGLHCPLIIRIPEDYRALWPAEKPGTRLNRLVSFVDMPKTWLHLAGVETPDTMQGRIFIGDGAEKERELHFAFRGRMDERVENARAVCDKRYLYIRNYMPYIPWMQKLHYLWRMQATKDWAEHVKNGKASELQARFFHPKGWGEELYDMQADPDNVNNLAGDPAYSDVLNRMRAGLRKQQLEVFDTGLLPESEMVKRAKVHQLTIYDMVRDPKLYDLAGLLDAADLALEQKAANLPALHDMLEHKDAGIRYWGTVGCFLLKDADPLEPLLTDPSHEVRAMAAWALIRAGKKDDGLACLEQMLKTKSYATLTVLNMLDWIGEDAKQLRSTVSSLRLQSYEARMQQNLLGVIWAD